MSHDPALQPAIDAVIRFAAAWTAWEVDLARIRPQMQDPKVIADHARLIADHCTTRKRPQVDGLPGYSRPPHYKEVVQENMINAESAGTGKAHVDFKCTLMLYRFVVHKKADGWRVDGIKWKILAAGDWRNGLIGM